MSLCFRFINYSSVSVSISHLVASCYVNESDEFIFLYQNPVDYHARTIGLPFMEYLHSLTIAKRTYYGVCLKI